MHNYISSMHNYSSQEDYQLNRTTMQRHCQRQVKGGNASVTAAHFRSPSTRTMPPAAAIVTPEHAASASSPNTRGHLGSVESVAFSPDAKRVATGCNDGTARIWAADGTGASIELKGHRRPVTSVAFSPDGRKVLNLQP